MSHLDEGTVQSEDTGAERVGAAARFKRAEEIYTDSRRHDFTVVVSQNETIGSVLFDPGAKPFRRPLYDEE